MHAHFAATADAPGQTRAALDDFLAADRRCDVAQLAASEIVTNAIRHGNATSGDPIELHVVFEDAEIRIEVRNRATDAFDPRTVASPDAGSAAGGWGLGIVAAVSRRWGVDTDDGRTIVWFVL